MKAYITKIDKVYIVKIENYVFKVTSKEEAQNIYEMYTNSVNKDKIKDIYKDKLIIKGDDNNDTI